MFDRVLPGNTQSRLALLGADLLLGSFYLAGGSATALHLGHRYSFDLDFFRQKDFDEKAIVPHLQKIGKVNVESQSEFTFVGKLEDIKISYFRYPYPLIRKTHPFKGIQIADLEDIACMKLDAISSRGLRRDFIDLYAIANNGLALERALQLFEEKYKEANYSLSYVVKSLSYFADAEQDDMPKMIQRIKWSEVKNFFEGEAKRLTKKLISS